MKLPASSLSRVLVDRRFTLITMSLAAIAMLCILFVPQSLTSDGSAAAPLVARTLGLDRIVSVWWFRALVVVAAAQLLAVTLRVFRRDSRRLLRDRGPASRDGFAITNAEGFSRALSRTGYLRVRRSATTARYVKHPWGYAGPTLLHGGMLLAACGVLVVTLTQSAGLLQLIEGQSVPAGTLLEAARRGPLGPVPRVETGLQLERLDARFWENGEPRSYTGTVVLDGAKGVQRFSVTTNAPKTVEGTRYYQEQRVGYAFFATIVRGEDVFKQRIDLQQPASAHEASYQDVTLSDGTLLRTKCLVDEAVGGTPSLVIRLVRAGSVVGEGPVTIGTTVRLDDTEVTVDAVERWGIITLERSRGYGLLFSSFFVIFLGAMLIYAMPPREVTITRRDDVIYAEWHASRLPVMYADEQRRLESAAQEGDGRT